MYASTPPRNSKLQGRWSSAVGRREGRRRGLPLLVRMEEEEGLEEAEEEEEEEEGREVTLMGGSEGWEGGGAPWPSK